MARVVLALHQFADDKAASETADAISAAGSVYYTDASGSEINVTVDTVSVQHDN
jgi:hypothetical protein